jgi:lysophospholipase L1-like esterase
LWQVIFKSYINGYEFQIPKIERETFSLTVISNKSKLKTMKIRIFPFLLVCSLALSHTLAQTAKEEKMRFFGANDPYFQYTGRIDFSNHDLPRFWSPGVYIQARFKGSRCEIQLNDEVLWGKSHNYITVVIDNNQPQRIKLTAKENKLMVADKLSDEPHTLLICKGTEAGIGYLEFVGIRANELLKPDVLPDRRIEFIGNSITCGTGSDVSMMPCGTGEWYDQHNAYLSYGPGTARLLNARWVQTSVSGIGLIHSCCNMDRIISDVIDKVNLNDKKSNLWDFSKYQPNVVTIMLGQNDGIQDSASFSKAYISFINRLRNYYPNATIICLTSPMADEKLLVFMKKMLGSIVITMNSNGDGNVFSYFFSKRFHSGCSDHPDLAEHAEIAKELAAYIKKVKNW